MARKNRPLVAGGALWNRPGHHQKPWENKVLAHGHTGGNGDLHRRHLRNVGNLTVKQNPSKTLVKQCSEHLHQMVWNIVVRACIVVRALV